MSQPAWIHSIRHPWFQQASRKRPLNDAGADSRDSKRQCTDLERGFAHLYIGNHTNPVHLLPNPSPAVEIIPDSSEPSTMDLDDMPAVATEGAILPSEVEEPTSPLTGISADPLSTQSRVQRSWSEPEKDRIIVTSLDDSDEDEDENDAGGFKISSAVLELLRNPPATTLIPLQRVDKEDTSRALILFKPVSAIVPSPDELVDEDSSSQPVVDSNAMDIEMN
ncbi:hypothetical protein CONPUDRAFT_164004 [Coniophora puteana RWD-64-598 SS2]|uniref:Uncharacterized protein n=1 Tax=Coniophora puteana (strain RWD-64-598) TaxID=741705 RepID=A0A5M3MVE9_CONPW|nr:uncharacterized protein CONPUDRAFT_164004 [Coniophora puteana RWD-64-598 SS2]EIW82987.1 hypothetical protein CONPUDRAFT_164004 [Coniophora puteana RWD-64-598 SS2]